MRPVLPEDAKDDIKDTRLLKVMKLCWSENPEERPEFYVVKKKMLQLNEGK